MTINQALTWPPAWLLGLTILTLFAMWRLTA